MVTLTLTDTDFRKNLIDEFAKHDFVLTKGSSDNYYSFKYKKTQFLRFQFQSSSTYKTFVTGKKDVKIRYFQNSVKTAMNIVSGNLIIDFDSLTKIYEERLTTRTVNRTNKNISEFKETLYLALLNEHLKPHFGEIRTTGYRYSLRLNKSIGNINVRIETKEMSKKEFGDVDFDSIIFKTYVTVNENNYSTNRFSFKHNIDQLSAMLNNMSDVQKTIDSIKTNYRNKTKIVNQKIKALEDSIQPQIIELKNEIRKIRDAEIEEIGNIDMVSLFNAKS